MQTNQLNRVFYTAQALQGRRSFARDLVGIEKLPEGIEFAKALSEALVHYPHEVVLDKISLAMGGNKRLSMELMESVQEIAKAHVESYTRNLPSGKVANVHAYETARTAAMKASHNAHGAGLHAMQIKSAEQHENASRQHHEASELHEEAYKNAPAEEHEIKEEHNKMHAQHLMASKYHQTEADTLRKNQSYANAQSRANRATDEAEKLHGQSQTAIVGHQSAAEMHAKAAEINPGKGHEEKAKEHENKAHALQTAYKSIGSPHFKPKGAENEEIRKGTHASLEAANSTAEAYKQDTSEAHTHAAHAHAKAMEHHLGIHATHEDGDAKGHHHEIAKAHMKLHLEHLKAAGQQAEVSKALADHGKHFSKEEQEELAKCNETAKADGGALPGNPALPGHDLAQQSGMDAMMVEGRPDEKDADELVKGHTEGYTRTVNGKIIQVHDYETAKQAAEDASKKAHNYFEHESKTRIKPGLIGGREVSNKIRSSSSRWSSPGNRKATF
jgi:hypothetical protein